MNWLNLEIRNLYSKQASIELEALELHLHITKNLHTLHFFVFNHQYENILESIYYKCKKKQVKLEHKFNCLIPITNHNKQVQFQDPDSKVFPDQCLIHNLSSETFTTQEITILNKGLKYNFKDKTDIQTLLVDVETHIQKISNDNKTLIRTDIYSAINKNPEEIKISKKEVEQLKILRKLQF